MECLINHPDFDLRKFVESLARDGQEGVKWERKKLALNLAEKKHGEAEGESDLVCRF